MRPATRRVLISSSWTRARLEAALLSSSLCRCVAVHWSGQSQVPGTKKIDNLMLPPLSTSYAPVPGSSRTSSSPSRLLFANDHAPSFPSASTPNILRSPKLPIFPRSPDVELRSTDSDPFSPTTDPLFIPGIATCIIVLLFCAGCCWALWRGRGKVPFPTPSPYAGPATVQTQSLNHARGVMGGVNGNSDRDRNTTGWRHAAGQWGAASSSAGGGAGVQPPEAAGEGMERRPSKIQRRSSSGHPQFVIVPPPLPPRVALASVVGGEGAMGGEGGRGGAGYPGPPSAYGRGGGGGGAIPGGYPMSMPMSYRSPPESETSTQVGSEAAYYQPQYQPQSQPHRSQAPSASAYSQYSFHAPGRGGSGRA